MYGGMWTIPVPDIAAHRPPRRHGRQPAGVAGLAARLPRRDGRDRRDPARGGKVIVIDPRRTGTAARADEWLPITPGHRRRVAAGGRARAVRRGPRATSARSPTCSTGVDGLRSVGRRVDARASRARVTGIPAERIRRWRASSPTTERAVVYGRIGLCNQEFGTLASWLVDVVNILTGHFDAPGGADVPAARRLGGHRCCRCPGSKAASRTSAAGAAACAARRRCSATCRSRAWPRRSPRRATARSRRCSPSPAIRCCRRPDGDRLDAALPELDCMISVDNWLNETTRHADVILPGLSPLEQPHHDDLIWKFAVGSAATTRRRSSRRDRPSRGVGDPDPPGRRSAPAQPAADVDVAAIDDGFFDVAGDGQGLDGASVRAALRPRRARSACSTSPCAPGRSATATASTPTGSTWTQLEAAPHGIDLGPMVPRLAEVLRTPDGQVELAPRYITADLPRLAARLDRPAPTSSCSSAGGTCARTTRGCTTCRSLVKGKDRCTLLVHPQDAERAGLADGELATVIVRGRQRRRAGRGDRRDDAGRGVAAARLGSRQAGHPAVGRERARRREHQRARRRRSSTCRPGNAAVNGIPVTVHALDLRRVSPAS